MTAPTPIPPTMPTIAAAPWEKITAVMLAVLLIAVVLVFSMLFPQPTDAQYATYKTILALAAGGFGSIIPGLIHVDLPLPKGVIRAAGAVVLFVVVFFFTPPPPASAQATVLHQPGAQIGQQYIADHQTFNVGITNLDLAKQLGVAESAVGNFLRILEQQQVPLHEWDQALRQIAERHKELLQRASLLETDDPVVAQLRKAATQAIDAGDYQSAEDSLAKAVARDNEIALQLKSSFQKRKHSAAQSQALSADSQLTRYALSEAIKGFELALGLAMEAEAPDLISDYRNSLGNAWQDKGDLDKAIGYYEQGLAIVEKKLGHDHPSTQTVRKNLERARQEKTKP